MLPLIIALSQPSMASEKAIRLALWKLPLNLPAMAAIENRTYEKAFAGEPNKRNVISKITLINLGIDIDYKLFSKLMTEKYIKW